MKNPDCIHKIAYAYYRRIRSGRIRIKSLPGYEQF